MSFAISGLPVEPFSPLFGRSDRDLADLGVRRVLVEAPRVAPCRVTLRDAEPGETVLLLNHEHQSAPTPYRSAHAIYVREIAKAAAPLSMKSRMSSWAASSPSAPSTAPA